MKSVGGSYNLNILPGEIFLIYKSLENSCQSNSLLGTVHSFSLYFQMHKCLADLKKKKRLVAVVKHLSKNKHVMLIFPSERILQVHRPQRIQPISAENVLLIGIRYSLGQKVLKFLISFTFFKHFFSVH